MSNDDNFTEDTPKLPSHYAYNVKKGTDNKDHWQKIGAAWATKQGGLSLQLDTMPFNGKVALRSREALEQMRAENEQKQEPEKTQDINPAQ